MRRFLKLRAYFVRCIGFVLLFGFISLGAIGGCNNNSGGGENGDLRAELVAEEFIDIFPGRLRIDASGSSSLTGNIISFNFTVINEDTGEIIADELREVKNGREDAVFSFLTGAGSFHSVVTVEDDQGNTDTAEALTTVAGTCESVGFQGQTNCCKSGDSLVYCLLNPDSSNPLIEFNTDILDQAQISNSSIDDQTVMWIRVWGANGGDACGGSSCGSAFSGGSSGKGGYLQVITSIEDFKNKFGNNIYYFLGNHGTHTCNFNNCGGGSGGASSILTNIEPSLSTGIGLDNIIALVGGGGGAGSAGIFKDGHDGGRGAFGILDENVPSNFFVGHEESGGECKGGSASGEGKGGSGDDSGNSGIGGMGGSSAEESSPGWINVTPAGIGSDGKGGSAGDTNSGGGGGGLGGGGGTHNNDPGHGGCGGGSFGSGGSKADNCAGAGFLQDPYSAEGDVAFIFNLDPNSCN